MDQLKLATIHRLHDDIRTIESKFNLIEESLSKDNDDQIILFYLRDIVARCDYVSNQIEENFKK